jgi:hypothetical protein
MTTIELTRGEGWPIEERRFSSRHRSLARIALDRVLTGGATVHLAYLSGSLAVGLGHGTSDVDLWLVGDDDCASLKSSEVFDGTMVQVNPIPRSRVDRLIDLASAFRATVESREQLRLDDETLASLIRLAVGEIVYVSGDYAATYALLDRDVVRKIIMATNARLCAAYAEDAVGGLQANDWRLAVRAASLLVSTAAECLLAAADDIYVPYKPFLHKRVARTFGDRDIENQIWEAASRVPPLGAASCEVRAYVLRALTLANSLGTQSLTDGWHRPIKTVRETVMAGEGPIRDPTVTVMRYSDGIGLSAPNRGFRITEPLLRIWSSLNGGSAGEAFASLRERYPEFAGKSDASLDTAVQRLIDAGAAHPSWSALEL